MGPDAENTGFSEEIQEIFSDEREFIPQCQDSTPSMSNNAHVPRDNQTQMNQQDWNLFQDAAPESPRALLQSTDDMQTEELLSMHCPTPTNMATAICLMVEDPYFDTAMSSPASKETREDPSLDWRGSSDFKIPLLCVNDQDLELNAATSGKCIIYRAVGRVWASQMLNEVNVTGTVDKDEEIPPPLPQRTPESYILAADTGGFSV